MFEDKPKIHVQMSRKVSDGAFGYGEVSMTVSHIPFDATAEEVDQYVNKAAFVVDKLREELRQKIRDIRKEREPQESSDSQPLESKRKKNSST